MKQRPLWLSRSNHLVGITLLVGIGALLPQGAAVAQGEATSGAPEDTTTPPVPAISTPNRVPSGPTARIAAQLKYYPPNNYLAHYLGDDRYKIAGSVWKVVTTQLDTYYHRANCPNMLKQAPDIVIGFPNKAAAEEGGYQPDPVCHPDAEAVTFAQLKEKVTDYADKPRPLILADGASSVTLPAGWRRMTSTTGEANGTRYTVDIFQRKDSKGLVEITTAVDPKGMLKALMKWAESQDPWSDPNIEARMNTLNPQFKPFMDAIRNRKTVQWGGAKGTMVNLPAGSLSFAPSLANLMPQGMTSITVSKGSKLYTMRDTENSKSSITLRNSFKAR